MYELTIFTVGQVCKNTETVKTRIQLLSWCRSAQLVV